MTLKFVHLRNAQDHLGERASARSYLKTGRVGTDGSTSAGGGGVR